VINGATCIQGPVHVARTRSGEDPALERRDQPAVCSDEAGRRRDGAAILPPDGIGCQLNTPMTRPGAWAVEFERAYAHVSVRGVDLERGPLNAWPWAGYSP